MFLAVRVVGREQSHSQYMVCTLHVTVRVIVVIAVLVLVFRVWNQCQWGAEGLFFENDIVCFNYGAS